MPAHRYEQLVQSVVDDAIYMLDPDGMLTNWNAGAERIKGYQAAEIVGQHFGVFYTPEDRAAGMPQRSLAIARRDEAGRIARNFDRHGFATVNLSDDELAKEHVRHMVGGHSELARDERLFRFVFPERPGALMRFLSTMHPGWNISLFHYRNQGADYGRILVGIQVPKSDGARFKKFLATLAYPCIEETLNPAYRVFLR